jgi:hypothetical protein
MRRSDDVHLWMKMSLRLSERWPEEASTDVADIEGRMDVPK